MFSLFRTVVPRVSRTNIPGTARLVPLIPIRALSQTSLSFSEWQGGERGQQRGGGGRNDYQRPYQAFKQKRPSSQTIWVGNLPYSTTEERLREIFSEFGNLTDVRIGTTQDGVSKGFAHIDFTTIQESEAVVDASSKEQFFLDGRQLRIDFAGQPGANSGHAPSNILHIGNYSGDEAQLADALAQYKNSIDDIRLVRTNGRNFGFVTFTSVDDAKAVKNEWDGKEIIPQEPIKLGFAAPRRDSRYERGHSGWEGADGGRGGYSQGYEN